MQVELDLGNALGSLGEHSLHGLHHAGNEAHMLVHTLDGTALEMVGVLGYLILIGTGRHFHLHIVVALLRKRRM